MNDERSRRVAIIDNQYVNGSTIDAIAAATATGWGVLQLPDPGYGSKVLAGLYAEIAAHVYEFVTHDYRIVIVGGNRRLTTALDRYGIDPLPTIKPKSLRQLIDFLTP